MHEWEKLTIFTPVQHYLLMTIHFPKQLESNSSFAINSLSAPRLNVAQK